MSTTDGHTPDQSLSHGPETPRRKPILVIDTNVLIRSGNMEELLAKYELHTVPSVTKEVKDATARMRLEALLPKLTVAAPDTASLKFVSSFAKNTGDFVSLSGPDMEVISLGYQRVKEKGMIERLKSESLKPIDFIGGKKFDPNDYEEGQDDDEREEEEDMQENSGVKEKEKTDGNEERNIENGQDKVAKESEDGEDDDDEWITVPAKPVPQPKTNKRSNNETQQDDHSKRKSSFTKNPPKMQKQPVCSLRKTLPLHPTRPKTIASRFYGAKMQISIQNPTTGGSGLLT